MKSTSLAGLALSLVAAESLSAQASIFLGPPGGTGDVLVFPAPGSPPDRPAELQDIRLLPIDACGRTAFTQFLPGEPRLRTDVPLAARVVLPEGMGSLYRYRRDRTGGANFGYFLVGASGAASPVTEFPGTGPTGTDDPFPLPVAVSAQGDAILVATTLASGGDVYEIELATGIVHEHSASHPPLAVGEQGLCLLSSWGVVLADSGPLRFARGTSSPAQPVFLLSPKVAAAVAGSSGVVPAPPRYFGSGIVRSSDQTTAAIVAGAGPKSAHVFVFGRAGLAACVNDTPAWLAGTGFGTTAGPMLALSPDGSRAAWKTEGASGECFTRAVPRTPTPREVQITADAHFDDTLNDTGVVTFVDQESVILLVGERNGAGGVEHADFYRARFAPGSGALTLTNLSNTSGDGQAPFDAKGDIETTDGVYRLPGGDGVVFFVPGSSGQGTLLRMDAAAGSVEVVRTGVAEVNLVELVGPDLLYAILHDQPSQHELLRIPADLALPAGSLGTFGATQTFSSWAANRGGTFAAALTVTGGELLGRIHLPSGTGGFLTTTPRTYGPTLGFDGSGGVLGSEVQGSSTFYFSWAGAGGVGLYPAGGGTGFVLPGA